MADLSWLYNGAQPQTATGSNASSTNVPDWLMDYRRGIAAKTLDIAGGGYQPYPETRIADFNPDQLAAFQAVRDNQGAWKPGMSDATATTNGISPGANARLAQGSTYGLGALGTVMEASGNANRYAGDAASNANNIAGSSGANANSIAGNASANANSAVAGPAQNWTDSYQKYMSPFTSGVVDEIGRLGNRNLMENIVPGVQDQFLGSGQFGSTRNADILGRSIRDAQADISGKQAQALESGYGMASGIFGNDANRTQQQQQLQANTALGAGQLGTNTALGAGQLGTTTALNSGKLLTDTALTGGNMVGQTGIQAGQLSNQAAQIGAQAAGAQAQQQGALAQMRQTAGTNDATALGAIGGQQQQLSQQGLNMSYDDFMRQRDWDKNNLSWMNGMVNNLPVNTTQTSYNNTPGQNFGASPFQWMASLNG